MIKEWDGKWNAIVSDKTVGWELESLTEYTGRLETLRILLSRALDVKKVSTART